MTDPFRDRLQVALDREFQHPVQLGRELGGGGMSRVFIARDQKLARDVVVKVLSPELAQAMSTDRFGREIALAAALQHANIVPLLAAGATDDGLPFYLMPFVEGASLRDRVAGGQRMPIADVLLVLTDVCRALVYAHGRGVVHRDIKPDNVMLSGGAALVTDFGIAKAMTSSRQGPADTSLTRMGTSLGSPAYMAPEQGAGDPDTDHRADLYSLGAMAYELLTGHPPFGDRPAHAQLVAHVAEPPVPVSSHRDDIPEPLARLVMQCLEKDPDDRPQQASALLEPLADAASMSRATTSGVHTTRATHATGDVPQRQWRAGMLAVVLLTATAGGALWFRSKHTASAGGPDRSLVAIMPFTVRDASLSVWHEGLVDMLARALDGAGAIRTVAPSTVIAKSPERADVATAAALGRALGAGLVVFGEMSPQGKDSVQVRAALVDVARGTVQQEVSVSGDALRMNALSDSLALRLLRAMGGTTDDALSSMGTSSLPALKHYLQGHQYYRRGIIDSSRLAYEAAVRTDSLFGLAWRGVASIYIRTGREGTPEAQAALDHAIRLRRGGSPRDSFLLRGDSLRLAVVRRSPVTNEAVQDIPALAALFSTLREAVTRYPGDAELWLELGDAGYHFGELSGVSPETVLQDFSRAIALDSMVLVPYVHAYAMALRVGNLREAATLARGLVRLSPPQNEPYYRLQAALLDSAPALSGAALKLLDSLPATFVAFSFQDLSVSPEAGTLALAVAANQAARLLRNPTLADSSQLARALLMAQAQRGKRIATPGLLQFGDRAQLALVGLLPMDAVAQEARSLVARQPGSATSALPLLAILRDSTALQTTLPVFDSLEVQARAGGKTGALYGRVARGYLALARADSATALREFLAAPLQTCNSSPCAPLITSRLLARAGRDADAARVLDRALPNAMGQVTAPLMMQERAIVAERLGDRAVARAWYARVLVQWAAGDAPVDAVRETARAGLARVK